MTAPPITSPLHGRPAANEVRDAAALRRHVDEALDVAARYRLRFNRREARRVVAAFLATGRPPADLNAYVLWYADPTGEAAVELASRR